MTDTEEGRSNRTITIVLLVVAATVLLFWDVYVATNDVKDDTISEFLRDLSYDFWILPYLLMGVMGHLFWNRDEGSSRTFRPQVLVGSSVLVGLRDVVNAFVALPTHPYAPLVTGLIGFTVGAMFWPQARKAVDSTEDTEE